MLYEKAKQGKYLINELFLIIVVRYHAVLFGSSTAEHKDTRVLFFSSTLCCYNGALETHPTAYVSGCRTVGQSVGSSSPRLCRWSLTFPTEKPMSLN